MSRRRRVSEEEEEGEEEEISIFCVFEEDEEEEAIRDLLDLGCLQVVDACIYGGLLYTSFEFRGLCGSTLERGVYEDFSVLKHKDISILVSNRINVSCPLTCRRFR